MYEKTGEIVLQQRQNVTNRIWPGESMIGVGNGSAQEQGKRQSIPRRTTDGSLQEYRHPTDVSVRRWARLELLGAVLHEGLVEVLSAEVCVPTGRLHLRMGGGIRGRCFPSACLVERAGGLQAGGGAGPPSPSPRGEAVHSLKKALVVGVVGNGIVMMSVYFWR